MENIKGIYVRATKDVIDILISIIQDSKDILFHELIEVKKDIYSHEYTLIGVRSRKVSTGENMLHIKFKNESRRIHNSYNLQEKSRIKFDFFLEENLSI